MSHCKTCGGQLDWGFDEGTGKWVPLEPIEKHDDLPRRFQDENGVLRADHRDRHGGSKQVNVTRLTREIPAAMANEHAEELKRAETNRRRRERRQEGRDGLQARKHSVHQ
jgi:hypothetical protein